MGNRPSFNLVFGIDNLDFDTEDWSCTDSRFQKKDYSGFFNYKEKVVVPKIERNLDMFSDLNFREALLNLTLLDGQEEPKNLGDLLFFRPEEGEPAVIGYQIDSLYNNWIFWALAGLDEKFNVHGHIVIPQADPMDYMKLRYLYTVLEANKKVGDKPVLSKMREL